MHIWGGYGYMHTSTGTCWSLRRALDIPEQPLVLYVIVSCPPILCEMFSVRPAVLAGRLWSIPLIPATSGGFLWVRGQPGLQSEFQHSQGYTVRPCLGGREVLLTADPAPNPWFLFCFVLFVCLFCILFLFGGQSLTLAQAGLKLMTIPLFQLSSVGIIGVNHQAQAQLLFK